MFERLNGFASEGKPAFFYSDFKGERFHCFALEEISDHDIEFSFLSAQTPREHEPHVPEHIPVTLDSYREKFNTVLEHIRSGNTYLLNLTQPTQLYCTKSIKEIYASAYAPYKFRIGDSLVCFSPEPFVTIEGNTITTFPMKGTIDASLPDAVNTILNDPKEIAEHTMIVDLLRNDLGMVARDIRVKRFRFVTTISAGDKKLHQISSEICGTLQDDWRYHLGTLLKTLLPAGSISGTPKKKTVEIIEEIEGYERGYFTGIFGYFDGNNLYSAVSIRYIEKINDKLIYKSGGGITAESECISEYREMIAKVYIP